MGTFLAQDIIPSETVVTPTKSLGDISNFREISVGAGASIFKVNPDGIWAGASAFTDAPFKVSFAGAVTATSISINGRDGATIAAAINAAGNIVTDVINPRLDTDSKKILADFNFGTTNYAGGVKAGTVTWATDGSITGGSGVVLYRGGLVGVNNGQTTFSINATDGSAYFAGTLAGASGTFGTVTAGTFNGVTFNGGTVNSSVINNTLLYTSTIRTAFNVWVGDCGGHDGISLNGVTDFNNIFIRRRSDNTIFFRVNYNGNNSINYWSGDGLLQLRGRFTVYRSSDGAYMGYMGYGYEEGGSSEPDLLRIENCLGTGVRIAASQVSFSGNVVPTSSLQGRTLGTSGQYWSKIFVSEIVSMPNNRTGQSGTFKDQAGHTISVSNGIIWSGL